MRRRVYREPKKIQDVLPGVLRGLRPKRLPLLERVRSAWPEIVGEKVAAKSRPVSASEGILRVELESAALKQHLATFRRAEILEELKRRFPDGAFRAVKYASGRLS